MTQTKKCTGCLEDKPLEDFSKEAKGKYGRNSKCRICWSIVVNKSRRNSSKFEANRVKGNERSKARNEATMNTATSGRKKWTKQQDDLLREYWPLFNADDIAVELGRTYQSILWRAHSVLNLPKKRIWSHTRPTDTSASE